MHLLHLLYTDLPGMIKGGFLGDPNINLIFQFLMVAEQYGDSQVSR